MLSRWQRIGDEGDDVALRMLSLRAVEVYACGDADFALPSKSAIKASLLEVTPSAEVT